MLESLKRGLEIEDFPEMTFILSALILAIFLFTSSNLDFYENVLGFIPARPQIYALTTYMFVHANIIHALSNILFLIIAGIAIEETLGAYAFIAIYFASGYFAVIFDILGRFISGFFSSMSGACVGSALSCVNFGGPFIGASGAIFGVMAVASMIKPMEKVPTVLVILALIPFAQYYFQIQGSFNYFAFVLLTALIAIIALTIFFISPGTVPLIIGMIIFLFSWIFVIFLGTGGDVSNVGHLGGVLGGIISYFIFAKIKRT